MQGTGDGGNGIKYIGQHVFDFVSSFRNTVNIGTDALDADLFLNDLSNLTSSLPADGKVLHIDSNNKVGFRTFAQLIADLGGGDITSVAVAAGVNDHSKSSGAFALTFTAGDGIGLGLTGSSTGATNGTLTISVPDSGIDASAKLTNAVPVANGGTGTNTFSANGILVGNGTGAVQDFGSKFKYTDSDSFSIVADSMRIASANHGDPQLSLINTSDGAVPPSLNFIREPADNAGANGDEIGQINYTMDDSAGNATTFVQTNGVIDVATNGQESGRYVVQVASHDAELQIGLDIVGGSAEDEIDVTIASGAASVTTIEGTLTIGSTAFVDNSGVIQVATQGTIDHDSLANFVAAEHYRWDTDISSTATINAANIPTLNQNTSGTAAGLSSTLAVGSGGTGATSLTSNSILTGNGTSAIQAESTLSYSSSTLNIGTNDSTTAIIQKNPGGSGRLSIQAGNATESGVALGGDLRLLGGASCGAAAGGSIKFFSTPGGTESSGVLGTHVEIASLDSGGNLQVDGGITTGSTSFVNSSGVIQVATQGTIDHDSLANFVAAEHVDWAGASAGTIHSTNIPTLNQDTTGQAGTVATIAGLAPNTATTAAAQPNITSLGTLTALTVDDITINGDTITASADLNIVATGDDINVDTDNFTIENSGVNRPSFILKNTHAGNKGQSFNFIKDKGAAGANGDSIGFITWTGDDDAQTQTGFATIHGSVEAAAANNVEGKIEIGVAAIASGSGNNSTNVITGIGNGNTITDVTIGAGATGVTTIAGTLTMGSTAFVNNSGVIQVATQGTIDHDSLANFVANEHIDWTGSSAGTIHSTNIPTLNQDTTGNAATATALTSGNKTISGDLTANNVFLPGGGTISFDDSLDGSDQFITGTDSNLTIDGDDKIKLRADTQIEVKSTSNTDTVIITPNSGNIFTAGDIELGHASDTTIARSAAGTVTIEGNQIVTENKQLHVIPCNFFDDIGTTKHYIPISSQSISEQVSDGNTVTDFLCPCSTKVKEVMVKLPASTSGSGDLTIGIETSSIGSSAFSKSIIETETVAVASSNDNDIVHFMFDDTTHATIGQNLSITIQAASDLSASQNWHVITILEFDWSTRHTGSSSVQTS